ncbi:hypothetical protein LY76DRAFT_121273 [Colletotrichum caudatum]|nr:hypothetical protein LY76DRAFT_121273 [Colletotrichum caudatum]
MPSKMADVSLSIRFVIFIPLGPGGSPQTQLLLPGNAHSAPSRRCWKCPAPISGTFHRRCLVGSGASKMPAQDVARVTFAFCARLIASKSVMPKVYLRCATQRGTALKMYLCPSRVPMPTPGFTRDVLLIRKQSKCQPKRCCSSDVCASCQHPRRQIYNDNKTTINHAYPASQAGHHQQVCLVLHRDAYPRRPICNDEIRGAQSKYHAQPSPQTIGSLSCTEVPV